jgi:mono/diheme cytochrome c family protein
MIWIMVASMALVMNACTKGEPGEGASKASAAQTQKPPEAMAAPAAPTESAQDVFKTRCTPCHGTSGKGDGPASIALNPKPRNYTDAVWQSATSDEQLKKTIMYGGAAVGKSAAMPSQPDLESKPQVLDGLVKIIREFGAVK